MKDYYAILQVDNLASDVEIKKSFRVLALKLHPDRNKEPDAHGKFVEINEAFQILSDPVKRKKYDALYRYAVLKEAGAERPVKNEVDDFAKWAKQGEDTGRKYAAYTFSDFAQDAYINWGTTVLFEGLFDSLGNIIENAGDAMDSFFDLE